MGAEPKRAEDAPLAPPAVVKAVVEVSAQLQQLSKDLVRLRSMIDTGARPELMRYAVLSAMMFTAELMSHLVKVQVALAEGDTE